MTTATPVPRILIVEPNPTSLKVIARRLGEAGYKVSQCERAPLAIGEMRLQPIELVIAELTMAAMSGIDLVRMIRDESGLADVPVILIAGRSERTKAIAAFAAGADDVMFKPFDSELLAARAARLIERAHALRALQDDMVALDARVTLRAVEVGELKDRLAGYQQAGAVSATGQGQRRQ